MSYDAAVAMIANTIQLVRGGRRRDAVRMAREIYWSLFLE